MENNEGSVCFQLFGSTTAKWFWLGIGIWKAFIMQHQTEPKSMWRLVKFQYFLAIFLILMLYIYIYISAIGCYLKLKKSREIRPWPVTASEKTRSKSWQILSFLLWTTIDFRSRTETESRPSMSTESKFIELLNLYRMDMAESYRRVNNKLESLVVQLRLYENRRGRKAIQLYTDLLAWIWGFLFISSSFFVHKGFIRRRNICMYVRTRWNAERILGVN